MKNRFLFITTWICLLLLPFPALGTTGAPQVGDVLPDIILTTPSDPEHLKYLGLKASKTFKINQIKAEVVIIEIFSMYCPHCQKEAPKINDLFNKINNDPKLKDKLKLIGIGVGNSDFEVDVFRKNYKIKFPLFTDSDFTIHKMIGEVRTPFFIVAKINSDGSHRIIYAQLGGIKDNGAFIKKIQKLANQ